MCDPLTIGSAALMAGGTYMQHRSQGKAEKRAEQAMAANAAAQEELRSRSQGEVMKALGDFDRTKFDQTQAEETGNINQKFVDNLSQGQLPGEYYGGRQSENTKQYQQIKSQESTDFSKQMAEALARIRGFDQGFSKSNVGINRAGEHVVMNNNFMDGNNTVLPIQLDAARRSAANPLADIMVGVGQAGLTAGLAAPAGAGAGTAAANPNIPGTFYILP